MKTTTITILAVLTILALVMTGCSSTKDSNIIQVSKIAPENTLSIIYLDLDTMKNDPDCEQEYYDTRDSFESEMEGIQVSDITGYVVINVENGTLKLQIGEYTIGNIRDNLKEQGYTEDKYQGSEIWTGDMLGLERAFTFIDNMVVFGDTNSVEASLRAHNNDEPSLYDNEDVKTILDKLPEGIFHMIINTITEQHIARYGSAIGSISICNLNQGDEVLDIKGLFKFMSEAEAETYLERVRDTAEAFLFGAPLDVEVELKGQFIEITGTTDIEDLF
jgi:hypothetical protein